MTATLLAAYDHPQGLTSEQYAPRRGNMQFLDNDNVFMAWSERALQSEHAPDGTLLMEARFQVDWFGSYRAYKFPYVGRPNTLPDVHSAAYIQEDFSDMSPTTEVFVSWNGATEVAIWELHGTKSNGTIGLIDSKNRTGFETFFDLQGYIPNVQLKGIDKNGKMVGDSGTIKTIPHPRLPDDVASDGEAVDKQGKGGGSSSPSVWFIVLLTLGCVSGAGLVLLAWFGVLRVPWVTRVRDMLERKEVTQYNKIAVEELGQEQKQSLMGDTPVRSGSPPLEDSKYVER